jgi:hypothetical protein
MGMKISHEEYMKILENLQEENMKKIKEEYEQKMKEFSLLFEKTESSFILNKDNNILIIKKVTKENNKEINENNNIGIIKEEDIFKINKDEFNNINIYNEKNEENNINKKRKRNNNKNYINSDKIIKKIRVSILNAIIRFINKKIEKDFNNYLGIGISMKQFLQISKRKLSHSKINFDKEFLRKTLKEILSFNISEKYSNYIPTHNKNLVNYLLNLDNKSEHYKKLFELTFLDCIEYIRGTKYINILNGLDKIDDIIKYVKYIDEDEMENFKHYLLNYESILYGKKTRNSKKI